MFKMGSRCTWMLAGPSAVYSWSLASGTFRPTFLHISRPYNSPPHIVAGQPTNYQESKSSKPHHINHLSPNRPPSHSACSCSCSCVSHHIQDSVLTNRGQQTVHLQSYLHTQYCTYHIPYDPGPTCSSPTYHDIEERTAASFSLHFAEHGLLLKQHRPLTGRLL